MNTKLAIAALLLLSVTAGACVIETRDNKFAGDPQLEKEISTLRIAYSKGDIDELEYSIRRDMLITAWELKLRDEQL
ncbi:hypothetical protein [Marinimicrobium sp. ABcell2]|uniref:hypothetical protein n=1 Tax=Marinimicrobium sp. ABcell2 TaxID=3069751 RepID=UPI0027B156E3|nr:hypothetical protein [Marinimicrobium sp. ABcell2]MDQ2076823.1 hypothetical protein [Marinimicrobium sp. ABcell2]